MIYSNDNAYISTALFPMMIIEVTLIAQTVLYLISFIYLTLENILNYYVLFHTNSIVFFCLLFTVRR